MADGTRSKSSSKKGTSEDTSNSNYIKDLLKLQEETIKSFFKSFVETTNSRIDSLLKEVQGLKTSLEFSQKDLKSIMDANPSERLKNLESKMETMIEKADDLENRSRRNNLCFDGVDEMQFGRETWEQCEGKLKDIVFENLEIEDEVQIERAHRVGRKRDDGKPRPIVAKFLNYKDREKVLKARKKLKGSKIVIREDVSERVKAKQKELIPKMMEARREGKVAYIRHDKLIIHDNRYQHHQGSGPGPNGNPPLMEVEMASYGGPPWMQPVGYRLPPHQAFNDNDNINDDEQHDPERQEQDG